MLRVHLFGRPRLLLDEIAFAVGGRPKVVPLLAYILCAAERRRRAARSRRRCGRTNPKKKRARIYGATQLSARRCCRSAAPIGRGFSPAAVGAMECRVRGVARRGGVRAARRARRTGCAMHSRSIPTRCCPTSTRNGSSRSASGSRRLYRDTLGALVVELARGARLRAARSRPRSVCSPHDPWREDTLRALMVLRYESGDRAGALAEYERFARMLRAELDAEPMPETSAVVSTRSCATNPTRPSAGGASGRRLRNDAPRGALPFVGRARSSRRCATAWDAAAARARRARARRWRSGHREEPARARVRACVRGTRRARLSRGDDVSRKRCRISRSSTLLRAAAPLLRTVAVDPVWLGAACCARTGARGVRTGRSAAAGRRSGARAPPAVRSVRERLGSDRGASPRRARRRGRALGGCRDPRAARSSSRAARARCACWWWRRTVRTSSTLDHRLRAMRRRLERDGAASHVALARLSRDDVAELVARARRVRRRRGARARCCTSAATATRSSSTRSCGNSRKPARCGSASGVGRSTHRRTRRCRAPFASRSARASHASTTRKALAEVAAVVGRGFDVELLRETTGWPEASVLDALQTLVDRRIVGEYGGRGGFDYAFGHQLIQAVVYDGIAPECARRRHRRIAHVMAALYADQRDDIAAELALHWDRGGEPERATDAYLAAARRALAVYGNEEARRYLERALELTVRRAAALRSVAAARAYRRRAKATATRRRAIPPSLPGLRRELGDEDAICTVLERRLELDQRHERPASRARSAGVARSGACAARATCAGRRARSRREARYLRADQRLRGRAAAFADAERAHRSSGDRGAHVEGAARGRRHVHLRRPARRSARRARRAAGGGRARRQPGALVRTLMALSRAALSSKTTPRCRGYALEAHDISRAIGDREGEALALHTLANGYISAFRVARRRCVYGGRSALYERMRHRVGIASISVDYGFFHTELGLLDARSTLFARAARSPRRSGSGSSRACRRQRELLSPVAGRLREAPRRARRRSRWRARSARRRSSRPRSGCSAPRNARCGAYDDAVVHLRAAVELRRPAGATPRLGDNLCALARALLRAGDLAGARARGARTARALRRASASPAAAHRVAVDGGAGRARLGARAPRTSCCGARGR